jgi:hypothetical protein
MDDPTMPLPTKPSSATPKWRILACASQGNGSSDEDRLRVLLTNFQTSFVRFDQARKKHSFLECLRALKAGGFDLFVLEGTGLAAGVAAILGRVLWGRPYVVSSGDSVAPFLTAMIPAGAPVFSLYERLLYRFSSGYIGWTPYLVGRALTWGARRAVTVAGWAPGASDSMEDAANRRQVRTELGIPEDAVVFGMAGSLIWSDRYSYCYGSELVRAAVRSDSPAYVLIVGDGTGLERLKALAGEQLGKRILMTGRVPRDQVRRYLAAMDVGSIPQSVDQVGSFRYTTKLPEYLGAGLMILTNQIPMAYDLSRAGTMIVLGGDFPWSEVFLNEIAEQMRTLRPQDLKVSCLSNHAQNLFDRDDQIVRVSAFLRDILKSL